MRLIRNNDRLRLGALAALASLLLGAAPGMAMDAKSAKSEAVLRGHYFLVVWAYQGPDDDIVHAHTFTSFYKGDNLAKGVVHPLTSAGFRRAASCSCSELRKGATSRSPEPREWHAEPVGP